MDGGPGPRGDHAPRRAAPPRRAPRAAPPRRAPAPRPAPRPRTAWSTHTIGLRHHASPVERWWWATSRPRSIEPTARDGTSIRAEGRWGGAACLSARTGRVTRAEGRWGAGQACLRARSRPQAPTPQVGGPDNDVDPRCLRGEFGHRRSGPPSTDRIRLPSTRNQTRPVPRDRCRATGAGSPVPRDRCRRGPWRCSSGTARSPGRTRCGQRIFHG